MPSANYLLEYARFHEIATDHRNGHLRQFWTVPLDTNADLPDLRDFLIEDLDDFLSEPKLQLSKEGAQMLASSIARPPKPDWKESLSDHHRIRKLKIKQPLMIGDIENDAKLILKTSPHKYEDYGVLPAIFGDDCEQEDRDGPAWSLDLQELAGRWENKIRHEKLHITKDTMQYLGRNLRSTFTEAEQKAAIEDFLKNNNVAAHSQALSSKYLPVMHIQEGPLFELHTQIMGSVKIAHASEPWKVESPLRQAEKEEAKGNEIYLWDATLMRDEADTILQSVDRRPEKYLREPDDCVIDETRAKADAHQVVDHSVFLETMNSHTLEIDENSTTAEVHSGFWDEVTCVHTVSLVGDPSVTEIQAMVREPETTEKMKALPSPSVSTERQFAAKTAGFLDVVEELVPDMPSPEADLMRTSDNLMDQELLEVTDADIGELVDAAKFSLDQDSKDKKKRPAIGMLKVGLPRFERLHVQKSRKQALLPKVIPSLKRKALGNLVNEARISNGPTVQTANILRSGFKATNALSNFLDTRGEKFKKPKLTAEQSKGPREATHNVIESMQNEDQAQATPQRSGRDSGNIQAHVAPPSEANIFPIPELPPLDADTPRAILLNADLLQARRGLVRFLESCGGSELTIVYRELRAQEWRASPENPDAAPDIILSPSKSLVFTTLQALTQRALPGQGSGGMSPIHERVSALCEEYEQLFVLVTFPARDGCISLSDDTAMLQFTTFCTRLKKQIRCEVLPIFISLEVNTEMNDQELYTWTASLIAGNAFIQPSNDSEIVGFLQDETPEELFLRKAGMNAFAAQVVLGILKRPPLGDVASWGLKAFLQMRQEERLAKFEELIGRRALERMSARLDHDRTLSSDNSTAAAVCQ